MNQPTLLLTFFTILLINGLSYAQDSLLIEKIKQNIHTFQVNETGFSGEGSKILLNELEKNQFVLIGESHGIEEIGLFTKMLFRKAHPHDFENIAIETDPYGAQKIHSIVQGKNYRTVGKTWFQENPFSIPFYNMVGDLEGIKEIVQLSQSQQPLWGIDQVFFAGPRLLFQELAKHSPNEAAKALAMEYAQTAKAGFQKVMDTKQFDAAFILQFGETDYQKLTTAFKEVPQAIQILDDLKASKDIYMLNFQGKGYDNNYTRSQLMKRQFMQYYQQVKKEREQPKVLFRLGANHCGRGLNFTNVFDIGNLVTELANTNGSTSFHIMITGLGGTQNQYIPIAPDAAKQSPYDGRKELAIPIQKAIEGYDSKDWLLIDFRPLRLLGTRMLNQIDANLKNLIFNYDVLVLIPETTASTLLTDYQK